MTIFQSPETHRVGWGVAASSLSQNRTYGPRIRLLHTSYHFNLWHNIIMTTNTVCCLGIIQIYHGGNFQCRFWRSSSKAIYQSYLQILPVYEHFHQLTLFLAHQFDGSCWSDSLCIHEINKSLITVLKHASPLRNQLKLLTKIDPIKHNVDSRLGFILHTITGFHRPSLTHYYGFICHLTPTLNLGLPLEFTPLTYSKFRCQASPVTALTPC